MIPSQVAAAVQHHWWLFLLRGVAALAFGVLTLAWPGATLLVLMAFIAAYALVDGIVALVYAFRLRAMFDRRSEEHTSELQSQSNLVCRLLLEKKKNNIVKESPSTARTSSGPLTAPSTTPHPTSPATRTRLLFPRQSPVRHVY